MRRTIQIDPAGATALAERRRRAGVTQNAVALAVGLSEGTISKIETARVPVSSATRECIEAAIDGLARTSRSAAQ